MAVQSTNNTSFTLTLPEDAYFSKNAFLKLYARMKYLGFIWGKVSLSDVNKEAAELTIAAAFGGGITEGLLSRDFLSALKATAIIAALAAPFAIGGAAIGQMHDISVEYPFTDWKKGKIEKIFRKRITNPLWEQTLTLIRHIDPTINKKSSIKCDETEKGKVFELEIDSKEGQEFILQVLKKYKKYCGFFERSFLLGIVDADIVSGSNLCGFLMFLQGIQEVQEKRLSREDFLDNLIFFLKFLNEYYQKPWSPEEKKTQGSFAEAKKFLSKQRSISLSGVEELLKPFCKALIGIASLRKEGKFNTELDLDVPYLPIQVEKEELVSVVCQYQDHQVIRSLETALKKWHESTDVFFSQEVDELLAKSFQEQLIFHEEGANTQKIKKFQQYKKWLYCSCQELLNAQEPFPSEIPTRVTVSYQTKDEASKKALTESLKNWYENNQSCLQQGYNINEIKPFSQELEEQLNRCFKEKEAPNESFENRKREEFICWVQCLFHYYYDKIFTEESFPLEIPMTFIIPFQIKDQTKIAALKTALQDWYQGDGKQNKPFSPELERQLEECFQEKLRVYPDSGNDEKKQKFIKWKNALYNLCLKNRETNVSFPLEIPTTIIKKVVSASYDARSLQYYYNRSPNKGNTSTPKREVSAYSPDDFVIDKRSCRSICDELNKILQNPLLSAATTFGRMAQGMHHVETRFSQEELRAVLFLIINFALGTSNKVAF